MMRPHGDGASHPRRPSVLYVLGEARSGSTLLGNMLGELEGAIHAGEVRFLWSWGFQGDRRCGCGELVRECPLWSAAVAEALGPEDGDPGETNRRLREVARIRRLRRLVEGWSPPGTGWGAMDRLVPVLDRLYGKLSEASGSGLVIDSSKDPAYGALVAALPGADVAFVHLVRDPRATAYSWQRVKDPVGRGSTRPMTRRAPWKSASTWLLTNLLAARVARGTGRPTLRVRYEDLVAHPGDVLGAVARMLGRDEERFSFLEDGTVLLGPNHTASGNPSRFATGRIHLRPDEEWRSRMPPSERALVAALTLPLLQRYGYPLRSGRDDLRPAVGQGR